MNLIISVEFINPLYHGKVGHSDDWPPDPLRLYQALVRGSHEGNRHLRWAHDGRLSEAFRWLEQQTCSLIIAPRAKLGISRDEYVRNPSMNPDEKTKKVVRPYHMLNGQQIHYVWTFRDGAEYAQVIAQEARHLIALGWGRDRVIGRGRVGEVGRLTGDRWELQDGRGHKELRHPIAGTMDDLTARHEVKYMDKLPDDPSHPVPDLSQYRTMWYANPEIMDRPYAAFKLVDDVGDTDMVHPRLASKLASMMRHLLIQNQHEFAYEFPGVDTGAFLAGHVGKVQQTPPRFSYQVLPTIGPYGDGYIRRVLIAEQYGGDGRYSKWANELLDSHLLRGKDGEEYRLQSMPPDGVVDQYVQPSRIWRTVTPVVLRGWDDGNPRKLAKLLDRALEDAGIVDVDRTWIQRAPFFPGGLHSAQYCRPRHLQNGLCLHVGVKFCKPVEGPLALGSGRHAGLGIMATARA